MARADVMKKLEGLFKKHRSTPFPPSHPDEEIQVVHDHLIVYDGEIAGLVSRILEGDLSAIDRLEENQGLCRQIERLLQEGHEAYDLLREYLENCDRLKRMINLARSLK